MPTITIFTPIYNRAYLLDKLYSSLVAQSNYDFEWLIIDDGSIDDAKEVIERIIKEGSPFDIRYIYKSNGGKHTCINMATEMANGKLLFTIDSDDCLAKGAIDKVIEMYSTIKNDSSICAVGGLRANTEGEILGTTFSGCEYVDVKANERFEKNISGDKAEVYIINILKRYKFPIFEGETFMTECAVFYKMALDGYKIRYFNEVLRIGDYLPDGLTDNVTKGKFNFFFSQVYTDSIYMKALHYGIKMRIYMKAKAYEIYLKDKNEKKINYMVEMYESSRINIMFCYFIYKIYSRVVKRTNS